MAGILRLFALAFLFSIFLTGCGDDTIEVSKDQVIVIDGDTIRVILDNKKAENKMEKVRLLLIDSPELNHPQTGKQPYSDEAKQFVERMIRSGKKVTIETDESERDKFQRLLAYVYVDGKSVQEELIKNGLARVAYIYEPNTKYVDKYKLLEKEARQKKVGIWSIENYVQNNGFHPEVIQQQNPQAKERTTEDTGFIASKNSDVYHPASCKQVVDTIKPENRIHFKNEQEAQKSGRKRSKVEKCWSQESK